MIANTLYLFTRILDLLNQNNNYDLYIKKIKLMEEKKIFKTKY
jgi:hypothetical protein